MISGRVLGPGKMVGVRILFALGSLSVIVGAIWFGQGIGLIGGSFMTGEALWAVIGVASMLVGGFLIRTGFRWRRSDSLDDE